MKNTLSISCLLLFSISCLAQTIQKPRGCYAGSNGTNSAALAHTESRGVLFSDHWANIETAPGEFDFSSLNSKIALAAGANVKYTIAILGGTAGSPDWLMDNIGAEYLTTTFRGKPGRLPLWWDSLVLKRLNILITALAKEYSMDTSLSHIYVTQMTANGVEGHLQGVNMNSFDSIGFTNKKWIDAAKTTTHMYAKAFPTIPIVFEVHEIDHDTTVPVTIMKELTQDSSLCGRVGLGMWWISGKTSYQPNLIHFIKNFKGDKYAQIIGRSDQTDRFQDGLYGNVFSQAKELGIRYIEPWPYEFQHNTFDSIMQDFNAWADTKFTPSDSCPSATTNLLANPNISFTFYPNPTSGLVNVQIGAPYHKLFITVYSITGQEVFSVHNQSNIDISHLQQGIYLLKIEMDGAVKIDRVQKL